jgi:glycosyltransferase involved in cell wall biosynthesis
MNSLDTKKIAIVWEGYDAGGVDSYLSYLLDAWPVEDHICIFHNEENQGIDRLKKIMSNSAVTFSSVKTVFKYYDGKTPVSLLLKYLIHIISPILYVINVFLYKKKLQPYEFDILMAQNGGYPGSYGVLASCLGAYLAKIKTISLVIHHSANPPRFGHKLFRFGIEKYLSKILGSIVAISEVTKKTIQINTNFFKNASSNIVVIENGVPVPNKKKINSPNRGRIQKIGIIGRLDPHKGHDDFLKALSLIPKVSLSMLSVEFIGGYREADFQRVSRLVADFGLEDIVQIKGYVNLSVAEIILSLDLVVMATKDFEGFGLTIVEALHSGVPVMATRVGIVPELFSENDLMSVEPGDVWGMARAIKEFIETEDKNIFISKVIKSRLRKYEAGYSSRRYRDHLVRMNNKNM